MTLPVNPESLRRELKQIIEVMSSCQELVDAGIPGDEMPAHDVAQEVFQVRLRTELILISQRLSALADTLEG